MGRRRSGSSKRPSANPREPRSRNQDESRAGCSPRQRSRFKPSPCAPRPADNSIAVLHPRVTTDPRPYAAKSPAFLSFTADTDPEVGMFLNRFPFREWTGGIGQQSGDKNTLVGRLVYPCAFVVMAGFPRSPVLPSLERPLDPWHVDGPAPSANSPSVRDLERIATPC